MANTYYRYIKSVSRHVSDKRVIELTAVQEDNNLMIDIITLDRRGEEKGAQHIVLTEQEQNDLIAGILERRGYYDACDKLTEIAIMLGKTKPSGEGISATGSEQSKIHPAEVSGVE